MIIPVISEETAVHQHLVPRTYMKKWCRVGSQVRIYDKIKQIYGNRNTRSINYKDYFYDFLPGERMPEAALEAIYGFMNGCSIEYVNSSGQSVTASKLEDYNTAYNFRDTWNVVDSDGHKLTSDEFGNLLGYLQQARYSFIEKEWSRQYENQWATFIDTLEDKLRKIKKQGGNSKSCTVTTDEFTPLFKYLLIYDWRCAEGDPLVNDIIGWFSGLMNASTSPIPLDERIHPEDETIDDEIRHGIVRNILYKFLSGESNVMDEHWKSYQKNLTFVFYLTDTAHPFITSDQPSLLIENSTGEKEHILAASPTLLISTAKKDKPGVYLICNATNDEVKAYNKKIYEEANMVILPSGIESIDEFAQ